MKKILIVAIMLLPVVLFSQQDSTMRAPGDSLSWDRSFIPALGLTVAFYKSDTVNIPPRYRKELFAKAPGSLKYFKNYKRNQTFFLVGTGVTGLLLLDVPSIGRTRAATLISGIGTFIMTYIFYRAANRNAGKAVSKWNEAMEY